MLRCRSPYLVSTGNTCSLQCLPGESRNSTHCSKTLINYDRCSAMCRTCVNSESWCTSCYENSSFPLLNAFNRRCVSECSSNEYADSGQCLQCSPNCLRCAKNPRNCVSCVPNSPQSFLSNSGVCVSTCLQNEVNNGSHCLRCSANCRSCTGSADFCTSCGALENCAVSYLTSAGRCVC